MMSFDPTSANLMSVLGAMFDICGAGLLASGLVIVKAGTFGIQSISAYGGRSPPLVKMFCEQRVDATFGLALLVVGFGVQAVVGLGVKATSYYLLLLGIGLLLLVLVIYVVVRSRMTKRLFKRELRVLEHRLGQSELTESDAEDAWVSLDNMSRR